MDRTELDWTRPDRNYRTRKNRTGLDQTGQDQTRPEWIIPEQTWPDQTRYSIFSQKKGLFGQLVPENGLPSGRMGIYLKTEGNQSYLGIWGRYDPIEPGLSEAKKVGYMGIA